MGRLRERLYFGLQGLRGGVDPGMISRASEILEAPRSHQMQYVCDRLGKVHGAGRGGVEWLRGQPATNRDHVRSYMKNRHTGGPQSGRVEHRHTSGSSGEPLHLVKDREMTGWMDAAMWAVYKWHGISPGDRQARFWGVPFDTRGKIITWLKDGLLGRRRMSAFEITEEKCVEFFDVLRGFRPTYAYAYPKLLDEFVHICSSRGLSGAEIGLEVVITTGELLTETIRADIADFFDCRVVDEYGCTESGVLAIECEYGTMHTVPVAALLEVVDESGSPVGSGEEGEVLVTDLYGETFPLLRYRLKDRITWGGKPGVCPCGRDLPAVEVEKGRTGCLVETPSHGRLDSSVFMYNMPVGIQRFRAHQVEVDRIVVRVVPGEEFAEERTPSLFRRRCQKALGDDMTVEIEVVERLAYDPSGKFQDFVPLSEARGS